MLRFLLFLSFVTLSLHSSNTRAGEAISIASGDGNGPKQPQAAVAADGTVYVVFGSGEEVSLCISTDNGKSFSTPATVCRVPNLSLGMRRGPRITVYGDSLIITAIGGKQGKGRDGDVLAWRSNNRGETWSGPVQVNDKNDSAREGLHAMTVSATGEAWCTWLDLRNQRTELYASKSVDGGASWSPNQLVYSSPEKSICECCHPSIAIHDKTIQVLFRNSLEGNRDMFLATVMQDGDKINVNSRQVGNGHWKLNACPMDGGMLAVDVSGVVSTVWRRGREIFIATSEGPDEQPIGFGEQPWITSTKDGSIVVWSKMRGGELLLKCAPDERVYSITANARDAVIVAEPVNGKTAFVFWEQTESGRTSIIAKAVEIGSLRSKNLAVMTRSCISPNRTVELSVSKKRFNLGLAIENDTINIQCRKTKTCRSPRCSPRKLRLWLTSPPPRAKLMSSAVVDFLIRISDASHRRRCDQRNSSCRSVNK